MMVIIGENDLMIKSTVDAEAKPETIISMLVCTMTTRTVGDVLPVVIYLVLVHIAGAE